MTDNTNPEVEQLVPVDVELGPVDTNDTPEAKKDIEERIDIINEGLPDDENEILDGEAA